MSRILSNWGRVVVVVAASSLLVALAVRGLAADEPPAACRPASALPDSGSPDLDCPAPPNTFDVSGFFAANADADAKLQAGFTYDAWAWASFAAMNWPAKPETDLASYPTGFQRGVPDTSGAPGSTFATAANDAVLVWETFKEKRELFHPTAANGGKVPVLPADAPWQGVTFDPSQVPNDLPNGSVLPCNAQAQKAFERLQKDGHHRFLGQATKQPAAGGVQAFDETVEVASPALEPTAALCAGYTNSTTEPTNPTLAACQEMFPENEPNINGRPPVGPRIWNGNPNQESARPLYFEVKVNYDFWAYILENGFNDDTKAGAAARSAVRADHPKLPFRTSAASGPGRSPGAVFNYDANQVAAAYMDLADPNALPPVGSVQAKAAWLLLDPEKYPQDDPSKFHVTEAVYYRTNDEDPGEICYDVDTFGLLGLHIIQRVHAGPFDRNNPELFAHGGTFVFATWEHVGLGAKGEPTDYYYANYLAFPGPLGGFGKYPFDIQKTPFPNYAAAPGGALPVVRKEDYPLGSTRSVNSAVYTELGKLNPAGSVWRNYQLVGTQFFAVGSEATSLEFNQPYYLANLLVETNDGLQDFQGLPPGVTVTPYYTDKIGIHGTNVIFDRDLPNVVFNRELNPPINMGGCMGCHGVAQLKGFNFSFVFAAGQLGAGVDTQDDFEVAGAKSN